jgi:hypothetical protein
MSIYYLGGLHVVLDTDVAIVRLGRTRVQCTTVQKSTSQILCFPFFFSISRRIESKRYSGAKLVCRSSSPPPQLGLNSNSMALLRYTSDKVRWSDMGLAHVMYDSSNFCVLLVHGQIVRSGRIQEQC